MQYVNTFFGVNPGSTCFATAFKTDRNFAILSMLSTTHYQQFGKPKVTDIGQRSGDDRPSCCSAVLRPPGRTSFRFCCGTARTPGTAAHDSQSATSSQVTYNGHWSANRGLRHNHKTHQPITILKIQQFNCAASSEKMKRRSIKNYTAIYFHVL